jgi:hypothetical protein
MRMRIMMMMMMMIMMMMRIMIMMMMTMMTHRYQQDSEAPDHLHFHHTDHHLLSVPQGLLDILPERLLRIFSPQELRDMVSGPRVIDVASLRKHCTYERGLRPSHPLVQVIRVGNRLDVSMETRVDWRLYSERQIGG